MLALIGQRDKRIAAEKRAKTATGDIPGNRPPPEIRQERVRTVRRQIAEGKYDIEKRLSVTSDKLWEAIVKCVTQDNPPDKLERVGRRGQSRWDKDRSS